jgi:enterochelin esterase-like enzyme
MKLEFPSREFDDAVAAVCHGEMSEDQAQALNELFRRNPVARDDYILRVELHSRLATHSELFVPRLAADPEADAEKISAFPGTLRRVVSKRTLVWAFGLAACLALLAAAGWRWRQLSSTIPEEPPRIAVLPSDWKPSATNRPGQEFPRINSQGRVQFRIKAPNANQVSVNIASSNLGAPHVVSKGKDGVWTITTAPVGIGFHFYRVLIDGQSVADPATQIFRGGGGDWMSSAIEVPTGEDIHEDLNVPRGEIHEQQYFSRTTGGMRRIFVYTPPGYHENLTVKYPVLYLLPGAGEDETCWPAQGRVRQIMDNLIAEQKARPMLVVMESGVARRPGEPETAARGPATDPNRRFLTLEEVFLADLVPTIDRTYRTMNDGAHRALAGLSLGAVQAFTIGARHPQHFASLGGFSGSTALPARTDDLRGLIAEPDGSAPSPRLIFLSRGADEPEWVLTNLRRFRDPLPNAGTKLIVYESPGTGHEWHTWRRSLREFAALLFKD